jgi:hypothetical protein
MILDVLPNRAGGVVAQSVERRSMRMILAAAFGMLTLQVLLRVSLIHRSA